MLKYIILFGIFIYSTFVLASPEDLQNIIEQATKNSDASIKFLSMIFGSVDGILPASNVVLVPMMIKYFNYGLFSYVGLIISYSISMSAIKTASQGKLLGKQGGGVAAFFRIFTSAATIMPLPNLSGFSFMQLTMLKIIITGVGLANSVWMNVTDYVTKNNSIIPSDPVANTNSDFNSNINNEQNLNTFLYCISYNDIARDQPNSGIIYGNKVAYGYKIQNDDGDKINLTSDYSCGNMTIDFGINLKRKQFTGDVFSIFSNYLNTVKKISDLAAMALFTKETVSSQYELYNASKNAMINQIKKQLSVNKDSAPKLSWDYGWIFAGMQYNRLIDNSLSQGDEDDATLSVNITGSSFVPNRSSEGYFLFQSIIKNKNNIAKDDNTVNTKSINDIYLKAILTVVPVSPESAALGNLEPNIPIPKKDSLVKKTIQQLEANNMAEARGNKSLASTMDMSFSGMLKSIFISGWNFGMFYSADFDDSKGPLNIVERDRVVSRDIQIFALKIYRAWLKVMPSKYRIEPNPIVRIRNFGFEITSAGFEFFINIIQDTYYAATGAQLTALNETMQYISKALPIKAGASVLSYVNVGIWKLTNIPIVGFVFMGIWLILTAVQAGLNGAGAYFTMMSKLPALYVPLVLASRFMYLSVALAASVPVIVLGLMFAVYIPFLPFTIFLFSSVGWFITVIESIIAAPIIASGIAKPQGHDFLGKAQQVVMMLATVFIRPVCIILGFVMATFLFLGACYLFDMIYFPFIENYVKLVTLNQNGLSLAVIILMLMYGYLILSVVRYCFSLTFMLPSYISKWIGLAPLSGGEEESVESVESSMKEALSSGLQGASSGVSMMRQ